MARDWSALKARLFSQNQFTIKLGLEVMQRALALEGLESPDHEVVLVAGTNGKGTTSSFLSSILQSHGLVVGLFTSPHLIDFDERFRIDGRPVDRDLVHETTEHVLSNYADPSDDPTHPVLTYFELTTLIAATIFARARVDVVIYEVGLGGRLDATNAFEPDVSVITTIGFDHQAYLGDTLESICREKAGIMRAGRHVVLGAQEYEGALEHLQSCAVEHGALVDDSSTDSVLAIDRPRVQRKHAVTASRAARRLLGDRYDPALEREGLECATWPGRLERRAVTHPTLGTFELFVDGAHNPDGVGAFVEWARDADVDVVLFGAMSDKPLERMVSMLGELGAPIHGIVIQNPRAASAEALHAILGADASCDPIGVALEGALRRGHERIAVCGSLYLVGEVFAELGLTSSDMVTRR